MIVIDNTVISDDIADQYFVCELTKCKGACCIEGDMGAPLNEDELEKLEEVFPKVKPYLNKKGLDAIEKTGLYEQDADGDYVTPTVNGRECAYAIYDQKGILKCGIEQAFLDKKITFRKPISCYLYPIRITKYDHFDALNYDPVAAVKAASSVVSVLPRIVGLLTALPASRSLQCVISTLRREPGAVR